jgi:hypothetical protein
MAKLFFSYSHQDEELRNQLEKHLATLKREGVITAWHDRRIDAGNDLNDEISHYLEEADIILLLVSSDFLDSRYCYDVEMARALERYASGEAHVIPVILRHCDWQNGPLGRLLAVPKDGKPVTKYPDRDEAFLEIALAVRNCAGKLHSPGSSKTSPPLPRTSAARRDSAIRSSNLHLRREFTDQEKDDFLEQTFEFIANFFEGSLTELERRNRGISTKFRRIDGSRFTAAIYQNGTAKTQCKITLASEAYSGSEIRYSHELSSKTESYSEAFRVEEDGCSMFLRATMGGILGAVLDKSLSQEGAAEHLWGMLIYPLK